MVPPPSGHSLGQEVLLHPQSTSHVELTPDAIFRSDNKSARNQQQEHPERDRFGSQFEYLVSVLGFAAGFGSVWRFPFLVFKNGGGVFLIPYFILLFTIGFPAFYFETAIGQMFQNAPPKIFGSIHPKWKGLGIFSVLLTFTMGTYYNLILAYSLYFLKMSFSFPLPWVTTPDENGVIEEPWNMDFFYKDFLDSSGSMSELGHLVKPIFVCYLISLVIVFFCVHKGVAVSGKIALFTATIPYVLLFILMIKGLLLEGAGTGIEYLFKPDWSKLFNFSVWVDAANQVAFQVSTGCAVLVVFGSYRHRDQEIKQSSILIPMLTVVCGFLSSFVVFSFMGYMSVKENIPINDIPLAGPDLAFVVFPAVLTLMPFSNFLSIIFFLAMVFLGIDTMFAYVDCLAGSIEDEIGKNAVYFNIELTMSRIRIAICLVFSIAGFLYCSQGGFYYLGFIDSYGISMNLIAGVFIETYFFNWMHSWQSVENKIIQYIGDPTPKIYQFFFKYTLPTLTGALAVVAGIIQLFDIAENRWWCTIIGWTATLYPYAFIVYYYNKYKDIPDDEVLMEKLLPNKQSLTQVEMVEV